MQGGKKPTKEQQNWQDWQREQGCCNCETPNPSIHHCVGSTAKHNKIHIGQWWTIPLCYECHQGQHGIHNSGLRLPYETRKEAEKWMLKCLVFQYKDLFNDFPMPLAVIEAIKDYHK